MIAKVYSAIPFGYVGKLVEVEGDANRGLPSFTLVGMANKTITEARERVRSAILNSSLSFPSQKVTINLAPAELAKDGAHLDLPIALNVLLLSKQLLQTDCDHRLIVGELSLSGVTKPVRGIINIVETARDAGFKEVILPRENLAQATLVPGIKLTGVSTLLDLVLYLKGLKLPSAEDTVKLTTLDKSAPEDPPSSIHVKTTTETTELPTKTHVKNTYTGADAPFLDDIHGQTLAKRALTIAIAGHHNLLLSGPPGTGKTMLAHAAINLLPPPSPAECIAITKLHSLCTASGSVISTRPFRAPHHTASSTSIIGGGVHAAPGEISLAHHGILFLDELPEYSRDVIEALRQPLESKSISISRANQHVTYPANFMLIATMNPCPCGYLHDPDHPCTCTSLQIQNYQRKLSGPILDRFDLIVPVDKVSVKSLLPAAQSPSLTNSRINHVKNTQTPDKNAMHSPIPHPFHSVVTTPFRATRPKRMPSSTTVKSAPDWFTSGGSRGMPMSLHSAMYSATFSVESSTEVSRAAIYSLGWRHLNQAVW